MFKPSAELSNDLDEFSVLREAAEPDRRVPVSSQPAAPQ